jgi:hypothetical protein
VVRWIRDCPSQGLARYLNVPGNLSRWMCNKQPGLSPGDPDVRSSTKKRLHCCNSVALATLLSGDGWTLLSNNFPWRSVISASGSVKVKGISLPPRLCSTPAVGFVQPWDSLVISSSCIHVGFEPQPWDSPVLAVAVGLVYRYKANIFVQRSRNTSAAGPMVLDSLD